MNIKTENELMMNGRLIDVNLVPAINSFVQFLPETCCYIYIRRMCKCCVTYLLMNAKPTADL